MYKINDFSKITGIPSHSLRRLHINGKLIPSVITNGYYRIYSENQIDEAKKYVRKMKLVDNSESFIRRIWCLFRMV